MKRECLNVLKPVSYTHLDVYKRQEQAVHIEQALVTAKKRAGKDGVVLAFGSLSYLGEVIRLEENAERK